MKTLILPILVALVAIGITSCGPAWKLRKAEKLIASAVADGAIVKDQLVKHDTTIITREKVDTVFLTAHAIDTFKVSDLQIIVKHDTITKRTTVEVLGPRITRTINVPYYINRTILAPKTNKVAPGWRTAALVVGFLFLVVLVVIIYKIVK